MSETEEIYRAYRSKLLAFVRRRVGSSQVAEDILQDVFIKLLTKGASVKQRGKLRGWLYQVTRNAIADHWRADKRFEELSDEFPDQAEDSPAARELAQCLRPLIRSLPKIYRDTIRLSEIQQLPLNRVARAQRISLPGAKSRVQRGRKMLRSKLLDCCRIDVARNGLIAGYHAKPKCC